ncbi:MAG: hypothetical protein AAFX03_14190 [Pseudomonadota bacterium]
MTAASDTLATAQQYGSELFLRAVSRDGLYLGQRWLTKAAAGRLRRAIRALEAFLRRALILLALELEPELKPSDKEPDGIRRKRGPGRCLPAFQIFTDDNIPLGSFDFLRGRPARDWRPAQVPIGPLIRRLGALKLLLDAPETRIRRLAFHMARKRPGLIPAPDLGKGLVPNRMGTEVSALYHAFGHAILQQSRARPPPLPPALRARPRVRWL